MAKQSTICELCRTGRVRWRKEAVRFRQWSDRGYVLCRVTLPVGTCTHCKAKSLDPDSERIFDAAFQREYAKRK
jgi:hypothetical protein